MRWDIADMQRSKGRKPLHTVAEIAEKLGITTQALAKALHVDGAPKVSLRGRDCGFRTQPNRVMYRLPEVVRWYREVYIPVIAPSLGVKSEDKLEHERALRRERDRRYRARQKAKREGVAA